jgi:hypothetical protein
MKSQVNALLHVSSGILQDTWTTYPELKGSLSKDLDRLTLYVKDRGLGVFTLDLPALESLLLEGLETGRLRLEGPYSTAKSPKCQVPRLFSGLWLRIFDNSSCLKHEVDVNALFFLRQLLRVGKKIELVCSDDRIQAKVGEYHDIERSLRRPSFTWDCDYFGLDRKGSGDPFKGEPHSRDRHHYDGDLLPLGDLLHPIPEREVDEELTSEFASAKVERLSNDLSTVHLAQAIDHIYPLRIRTNDLFHEGYSKLDQQRMIDDIRLLNKIQSVADLIFGTFDPIDPVAFSGWLEERGLGTGFKHGPGAVAERLKNHEKSRFPNWPHKLQAIFPYESCGRTVGSDLERPTSHEVASRLICVPKTAKGPRLIAAEPTSHQWCQQLLLRFLFVQCKKYFGTSFIDFKDQSKSGDMVLEASLSGELATVDLSDASDRLTCWTVERMIRKNSSLLTALHAARTRYIRDEISYEPSFLSLRKFASQGTATTFPVMSLVMLCIALGSTLGDNERVTWAKLRELRTKVRVFGDDIIVPKHGYARLVRAMDLLQLKVNTAKSYVNGHFRESCGTDGYLGFNVTPSSPRTLVADSPASCQAVVDTSNNLFNKGLWYASRTALDLLPLSVRKYLRVVGRNEAGFSGLSSFIGSDERHLVKRWNTRLHRDEVRVWHICVRTHRSERGEFDGLLDFFARSYNSRNPRVVSESVDLRRTIARLSWEPQITDALVHHRYGTERFGSRGYPKDRQVPNHRSASVSRNRDAKAGRRRRRSDDLR